MSKTWMALRRAHAKRACLHGAMIGVLASIALLVAGSIVRWGGARGAMTPSGMLLGMVELFVVFAASLVGGYLLLVAPPSTLRWTRKP